MIGYILRRIAYGFLILLGVNALTFALFFAVNTPDDMARLAIGGRYVTPEAIENWKTAHGYDLPLVYNDEAQGIEKITKTVFYTRSAPLLTGDLGLSDAGRSINREIAERVGPSLALAVPTFVLGVFVMLVFSLMVVLVRRTKLEWAAVAFAVTVMSVSFVHHSRTVAFCQNAQACARFWFYGRLAHGGLFDSSGGYRHLLATGQRHFAVSRHVP